KQCVDVVLIAGEALARKFFRAGQRVVKLLSGVSIPGIGRPRGKSGIGNKSVTAENVQPVKLAKQDSRSLRHPGHGIGLIQALGLVGLAESLIKLQVIHGAEALVENSFHLLFSGQTATEEDKSQGCAADCLVNIESQSFSFRVPLKLLDP